MVVEFPEVLNASTNGNKSIFMFVALCVCAKWKYEFCFPTVVLDVVSSGFKWFKVVLGKFSA